MAREREVFMLKLMKSIYRDNRVRELDTLIVADRGKIEITVANLSNNNLCKYAVIRINECEDGIKCSAYPSQITLDKIASSAVTGLKENIKKKFPLANQIIKFHKFYRISHVNLENDLVGAFLYCNKAIGKYFEDNLEEKLRKECREFFSKID